MVSWQPPNHSDYLYLGLHRVKQLSVEGGEGVTVGTPSTRYLVAPVYAKMVPGDSSLWEKKARVIACRGPECLSSNSLIVRICLGKTII